MIIGSLLRHYTDHVICFPETVQYHITQAFKWLYKPFAA